MNIMYMNGTWHRGWLVGKRTSLLPVDGVSMQLRPSLKDALWE